MIKIKRIILNKFNKLLKSIKFTYIKISFKIILILFYTFYHLILYFLS